MTKVQMIVTESGEVINFDYIENVRLKCENPDHISGHTYEIVAETMNGEQYHLCRRLDYETSRSLLMSEIARAKQTDGIARFDGDIMARLHEKGV